MFKIMKIAGLCLASMLVMGMALAGNASAVLLWLVCLEGSGLTKYESSKCLKASPGGKWQSLGVRAGQEITVKLLAISILLSDTKTLLGNVTVRCSNEGSEGEGVIKANGEGEIRKARYANPAVNCSSEENCETVEAVEGIHLPWKIKLFVGADGKTPLSKIEAGGAKGKGKEPGWKVTCKEPIVGSTVDECENEENKEEEVKFANTKSTTELLVTALFEEKHKAFCKVGEKEAGLVKGSIAVLLPGGALSINPE